MKFEKGKSGNPAGRPKGSRHKLSESFIADILAHWQENGAAAVEAAYKQDPAAYVRIVASLMPKDVNLNGDISYTGIPIPVAERDPLDAPARPANGRDPATRH